MTTRRKQEVSPMIAVFAAIVIDGAITRHKEKKLRSEIDQALDARDKKKFLRLAKELNKLLGES